MFAEARLGHLGAGEQGTVGEGAGQPQARNTSQGVRAMEMTPMPMSRETSW